MKLRKRIKAKHIRDAKKYNMDEKGFLMGLSQAWRVICSYDRGSKFELPDDGNRELLTVIECVFDDGCVIPPLIIYKGAHHYMSWHRFTGHDDKSKTFWFSYIQTGLTHRILEVQ